MKKHVNASTHRGLFLATSFVLALAIAFCGALTAGGLLNNKKAVAETTTETTTTTATEPESDPSPAVYVAQKNANSVVGVITYTQT